MDTIGLALSLPYPPSANAIWRYVGGRVITSSKGRLYRRSVAMSVLTQVGQSKAIGGPVSVTIEVNPPDRRRRDIDNVLKATLDALTHAKIWVDDSQVKRLAISMAEPVQCGKLSVWIETIHTTGG